MYPKELRVRSQRDIYTSIFTAALFTVTKMWKQPKCPSTDKGVKKTWCIHTMEYDSAFKRDEILTHATMWTNSEDMLSETR